MKSSDVILVKGDATEEKAKSTLFVILVIIGAVAAIAGIDPQLYEAARMDGANRWHRIMHITLPSIAPTIILFFILSLSGILNNGFDHIWTFQNQINLDASEVLDTFIYKNGIIQQQYSYTTAVGVFKSVIAIILLVVGNKICKKVTGNGVI